MGMVEIDYLAINQHHSVDHQFWRSLHHPHTFPRRNQRERLLIYCKTTSVSATHATHCATYCTPCRPLIRAFSGWIRTPPPTPPCHPGTCICISGAETENKWTFGTFKRLLFKLVPARPKFGAGTTAKRCDFPEHSPKHSALHLPHASPGYPGPCAPGNGLNMRWLCLRYYLW